MKKFFLFIGFSFLFIGCASNTSSISPDSKSYEKIERTYFKGGEVSSEFLMTNANNKTGTIRRYGYNGKKTSDTEVIKGVKNGYETLYDPEGKVLRKTPFKEGYRDGLEYIYYPGGQVMVTTPFKNGLKHGKAIAYNVDGSVNKTATFKNGKIVSKGKK